MARRKRGGKTAIVTRKTRSSARLQENNNQEEVASQSPSESEESCSSGTPKSCNTPVEIEKNNSQPLTLVQHKKFGKFRCLIDDTNKTEISGGENDVQLTTMEIESNEAEVIEQTENIIDSLKSVEITEEVETVEDIPMCSEEIVQEIAIEMTESAPDDNVTDISVKLEESQIESTTSEAPTAIEMDENSNEDKSSDSNSKSIDIDTCSVNNTETKNSDDTNDGNSDSSANTSTVRRSSRIRSITVLKQRSKGRGLVRNEKGEKKASFVDAEQNSDTISEKSENDVTPLPLDSPSFIAPATGSDSEHKPVKVKSRWRRSSELEMGNSSPLVAQPLVSPQTISEQEENSIDTAKIIKEEEESFDEEMEKRLRHFETLTENQYLTERTSCKEAKKMVCDCFLVEEEIERGEFGCGEDCLNRLLMIECGNQCIVGERCTNKRFQKLQYAPCEVFRTKKKGFGIRATAPIKGGEFILEYVGEVLDPDEFDKRAKEYSKDKNRHYYFMALRSDAVIDATQKGNISRFINHSCDPNAETQKWTVNGELRIGFFSKRNIAAGEEITFDYQFQRYGKEAQKCFCEAATCRGWIGEEPDDDDDEDGDDDDDDEDEDEEEEDGTIKREKGDNDQEKKSDSGIASESDDNKAKVKRECRKRKLIKKQRKDIFEDLDLDDEIEMLSSTGVKNQTHTLKLSRLMVRAKEMAPRMQLLKLLTHGEEPCRRLFLDYHGLRLIHGWMTDVSQLNESESIMFRMEILKALDSLPIRNKTILQDSKVLSIVEKWSILAKTDLVSPNDSENNSPNIESTLQNSESSKTEVSVKEEIEKPKKDDDIEIPKIDNIHEVKFENVLPENEQMEVQIETDIKNEKGLDGSTLEVSDIVEVTAIETDEKMEEEEKVSDKLIFALASKLLERWILLKEDFRIPKKERIKQMKEHEREADRGYKAGGAEQESKRKDSRYSWKSDRYRESEKERRKKKPKSSHEKPVRKSTREERNIVPIPQLTKHERRQLFALQVAQEEETRRRKQQELWRQHEQRCLMMGQDPRLTTFDPNFPGFWNPNMANNNWPPGNFPPNMIPSIPPNIAPNMTPALHPNITPSSNLPPGSQPVFDMNCLQRPPMCPPNQQSHMSMVMPQVPNINAPCVKGVRNPPLPQQFVPSQPHLPKEEPFIAPLPPPPPVKLPPKWKCAKDKYGRPYYYHVKIRISQWEPPEFPPPVLEIPTECNDLSDSSSSSDTSSLSSDTSSDSEEDSEIGDTKLLLEIRSKLKNIETKSTSDENTLTSLNEDSKVDSPLVENNIDLILSKKEQQIQKRKREGLVQEIIISPRREEDRLMHKAEMKKYKETKEKLRRQKELLLEQSRKKLKNKSKPPHNVKGLKKHRSVKQKIEGAMDINDEESRKIKEAFRKAMATVMVQNLNPYRKPDCKVGRITNTEDFKHLARKLTHFVMLKEIKHCQSIEDLTCNESVKAKSRDFVRKYMAKFGEVYLRPKDEIDYQ